MAKQITPVMYRSEQIGDEAGLICHAAVDEFRAMHTERGARATTSAWRFFTRKAISEVEVNGPDYIPVAVVKSYLFTPDFVVRAARTVSDCYNSPGWSLPGITSVTGGFIIDVANQLLNADPPVPGIATRQ